MRRTAGGLLSCQVLMAFALFIILDAASRGQEPKIAEDLPTLFYQDFRGGVLPDGLRFRNVEIRDHLQFLPDGLLIKVQKPYAIRGGRGIGVQSTFGLRGDFDIVLAFAEFKADVPPSGTGVGFGLALKTKDTGEGVQIARVNRPNEQGILWSGKSGTAKGRMTPTTAAAGRFRLTRKGAMIASLWAPGTKGDEFQPLDESELGTNDIESVWVNSFSAAMAMDVQVKLIDLLIRGHKETDPVFDAAKSPKQGMPDNKASSVPQAPRGWLAWAMLIGLLGTFVLAFLLWFFTRKRRRNEGAEKL